MSEMEYHTGKLKLIPRPEGKTFEDQCKDICLLKRYVVHDDADDYKGDEWVDILLEDGYEVFVVIGQESK